MRPTQSCRPMNSTPVALRGATLKNMDVMALSKSWAENSALTPSTTAALMRIGVIRSWQTGQAVVSRGQSISFALLVVKGRMRVSVTTIDGEEQLLRWMLPGEISGLSSVFAGTTYPADLVAALPSQVLQVDRAKLLELISQDASVAVDLLRILGFRINQLFDTLADQVMPTL